MNLIKYFMKPIDIQKTQKFLLHVFTFVFSIVGIFYFNWGVFHIVYLFWFENFIRIIFFGIRAYSVDYVNLNSYTLPARGDGGKLIQPVKTVLYSRLFFYGVYFVFIIIGLGFILPFGEKTTENSADSMIAFMKVFTFEDWEFNIALFSCVMDELMNYIKDFKIQKTNSRKYPLMVVNIFELEDFILHLTIILSATFIFLKRYDCTAVFYNFFAPELSIYALPGIILAILIFGYQIFTAVKYKKLS